MSKWAIKHQREWPFDAWIEESNGEIVCEGAWAIVSTEFKTWANMLNGKGNRVKYEQLQGIVKQHNAQEDVP